MGSHTIFVGIQRNIMGAHKFLCATTLALGHQHIIRGRSRVINGHPQLFMHAHNARVESHVYIWTPTTLRGFFVGTQEKFGASPVLSGSPRQSCGSPCEYVWARMRHRCTTMRASRWTDGRDCMRTSVSGHARIFVRAHAMYVGAYMYAHTRIWTRIRKYGRTRKERQQPPTRRAEGYVATGLDEVL